MYDIKERKKFRKLKIAELIEELKNLPQNAEFLLCGDNLFYLHIEKDKTVVCLDTEDLEDDYIDDAETTPDDFWANKEQIDRK